jgi:nucleotide-binding universal stress UspA family protein
MREHEHGKPSILVAIDLSERDSLALARAVQLAMEAKSRVDLLHVVTHVDELESADVSAALEERARSVREQGLEVVTHVMSGDPAEAIVQAAIRERPSKVVLAAAPHDPRYESFVGSVSRTVAERAGCPVDIVRPPRPRSS